MRKKSNPLGGALLIGLALLVSAIAAIPKEVWIALGTLGLLAMGLWVAKQLSEGKAPQPADVGEMFEHTHRPTLKVPVSAAEPPSPTDQEEFSTVLLERERSRHDFCIPSLPKGMPVGARWVPPRETVEVAGLPLPGGMLYVGTALKTRYGEAEPALINPGLSIARHTVDVSLRLTDYWASYATISPEARRAYLQWLAGGRNDPNANIGYVFLFFYGLERRVLLDAASEPAARAELPSIVSEVNRLISLYGLGSNSFRRYASHFVAYIAAGDVTKRVYRKAPPPVAERTYELPVTLRIGLGQLAVDQQPVPADWALAWALSDPGIGRRTPVTRCAGAFGALFSKKYAESFGDGLRLAVNRTKLKHSYQAASPGLRGFDFSRSLGELPDVSATTGPVKKLQKLVDHCAEALDAYSRFIGRNPGKAHALEGLLQLPPELWPAPARAELDDIKARVGDGLVVMSFGELSGRLKSAGPLSREKVIGFARALESLHLGMEPDVLAGNRIPKAEDKVVLFATAPEDGAARNAPAYTAAAVTLRLACSVALADGEASAQELILLTRHVETWSHLSAAHRKRLKAHLRLQVAQPTTLATLKKKLQPLAPEAKRTIARFLAHLAQADGTVSPQEVKFLERVYNALQVDAQLLYGDLHTAAAPVPPSAPSSAPSTPKSAVGFTLDAQRIAQLQQETEQVSALLANVFVEDVPAEAPAQAAPAEEEASVAESGVLGLDADHTAFLRLLVSRASWSRQELLDAAADMELMLDGALEHVNEAALDSLDAALAEGEDPVEINQEILEKLPV
jgi:uncharacterized tellurite resistance protein B-like protein